MFLLLFKRFGIPALAMLIFARCQSPGLQTSIFGGEKIVPLFEPVIDIRQNLIFRFPASMVKPEQIGNWDTTQYLHFEPQVAGQFKWSAVDELVFSPDHGFAFATSYAASVTPALTQYAPDLSSAEVIRFETQQLSILHAESQWVKEALGNTFLRLRINLNHSVLPDDLMKGISIKIDGKPYLPELETHIPGTMVTLKLPSESLLAKNAALQATVALQPAKLPAHLKKWLSKSTSFSTEIAPIGQLQVYGLDVAYGEAETMLVVRLNQNFTDSSFSDFINVPGIENIQVLPHSLGIQVNGDFGNKSALELHLAKGLTATPGGILADNKTIGFQVGSAEPMVQFAHKKALYLPAGGNHIIGLRLEAIPEISVSVYQVFPNNILFNFHNSYGGEYYEENYYSEYQDEFGSLVYSQNFRTRQLKKEGNQYLLPLNFQGFPGQKGLYIVRVTDAEKRYIGDKKIISITDIGLLAKTSPQEIWVHAQSIASTGPVRNAKISVIGRNNQALHTAETDADGNVRIPVSKLLALNTQPRLIICETAKDFTYLLFDQTRLETSRFPVDGIPYSASGWQAEVYGPRNLYKPGETIELQVLLRDKNLAAVAGVPVLTKIINPMGKVVQILKSTTGPFGQGSLKFSIPAYLPTGTYQAELYGAAQELVATHSLHIEAFDPLPLEIVASSPPAMLPFGKDWNLGLSVDNMFGLPAAERPVEAQLTWENAEFKPAGFEDFVFDLNYVDGAQDNLQASGKTDAKGRANLVMPVSQIPENQGLLKIKSRIQVFDESQVPVYKTVSTKLLSQSTLLGYKVQANRFFLRRLNKIDLVSLDAAGKPVTGKAWVEINTRTYSQVMEAAPEEPSGYRYVSKEVVKNVYRQTIGLSGGKGVVNFVPKVEGSYEMTIRVAENCRRFLRFDAYVYAGENEGPLEEEASTEGNITITSPTKNLKPGDKAELHFQTPFDGNLTITLEQDRILKHFALQTRNKMAVLEMPVLSEMAPNVYVGATLTREIGSKPGQNPLTTAYGYASIPVQMPDKELKTDIQVVPKSTSGIRLPIQIALASGKAAGMAIAVVDEGILQVTDYKIPDPFQYFQRKRALNVETYSMFGRIFKSLSTGKGGTGGDGLYLKMAANEMDNKQLLSTFLSTEKSEKDPNGQLRLLSGSKGSVYEATVDIPAGFSGKVRIMVVSYNSQQVGYSEESVTIADPVTIKTSLPDYLQPGDRFDGTASFFNTSTRAETIQPQLKVTGCQAKTQQWPVSLLLAPGHVARLAFSLSSQSESAAKVSVEALVGNRAFKLSKNFEIKPAAWLVRHQASGVLKPGSSITQNRPVFIAANGLSARVEFGVNPFLNLAPAVKNLLRYPYGCLEQTVSAAFPLVYMPNTWLNSLGSGLSKEPNQPWEKNNYLKDAIQKVSNLQQYGGGFAYWPGGSWSHDYYSIYATQFLWEAKQAGYPVDPGVLSQAIEHVYQISTENSLWYFSGYGKDGKRMLVTRLSPKISYALYVSSLVGKPNRKALMQWKAQPERLDQEGRYMLACALLLAGDGESFNQIVPSTWLQTFRTEKPATPQPGNGTENGEEEVIKTTTQEEAFVLSALVTAWPNHPMVASLSARLRTKIALQAENLSTPEQGMALVALAKLMKANEPKSPLLLAQLGPRVLSNNKSGTFDLGAWQETLFLKNNNKAGDLYYWVEAQGKSTGEKVPENDNGLEIRKTWYNGLGQPIDPGSLHINDLVIVRLSLKSKTGTAINQIALVDIIPACLRIENKRIGQNSEFKTSTPASEPDYLDIRRDRIHFFCTAYEKEQSFYYAARVVGKGSFYWGPAEAQAMYQPQILSRNGGRQIQVNDKSAGLIGKR